MRTLSVLFAAGTWLGAQETGPETLAPDVAMLAKIRVQAVVNLSRLPNYTCVETVERSNRAGATRKFLPLDTLRLEVALVDGKEMFAWPGAKKFEDTDIRGMVTRGAIGNGNFAMHARSVFEGPGVVFDFSSGQVQQDSIGVRFDFHVPQMQSGYSLHVKDQQAIVGYHGSFWADPSTLDLKRMDVIADDIPVRLGLEGASDRMNYARIRLGDGEFLLPESSELTMTSLDSSESRNRVKFASCRQFAGESVLSFGDPPPSATTPVVLMATELPPGLSLTVALAEDIDLTAAAVGDPVRARLQSDIRNKGQLLFAKGATITGRITRLEKRSAGIELGIEFFEVESTTARAPLKMTLLEVLSEDTFAARQRKFSPAKVRPGEGVLYLEPGHLRVAHGILMFWRT